MLVSKIDYNMLSEIVALKEVVRGSVEAVMDEKITASHLATDVYRLLDLLDKLENEWKRTPPEPDAAGAAQILPTMQTSPAMQAPSMVEQVQVEQPPIEQVQVEQPPVEQVQIEELPVAEDQTEEPPVEQIQIEELPMEEDQTEEPPVEQVQDELPPIEDN